MICSKCKTENQDESLFCRECGNFIGTQTSLSVNTLMLTVLRADLADFTKMSELFDPEEVMGLLNLSFDRLSKLVKEKNGLVNRFIGDELIAIFGLPKPESRSPMMALFAAQEMHGAIREISLSKVTKEQFGLKIGIDTDNTFLYYPKGVDNPNECIYWGQAFARALHLQKMAKIHGTLVGENTYQRAKSFFEFREAKLGLYQDQSFISYELLPL